MYYEWNESLSVHIPSIDRQHPVLISYINDLHEAVGTQKAQILATQILKRLVNYTTVHFIYEEMLFSAYDYAEEEAHKRSHQKFIDQLTLFQQQSAGGDHSVPEKLLKMLKSWLNHHILEDDMAYSEFLLQKGVA